jgi:hypothetical protein
VGRVFSLSRGHCFKHAKRGKGNSPAQADLVPLRHTVHVACEVLNIQRLFQEMATAIPHCYAAVVDRRCR